MKLKKRAAFTLIEIMAASAIMTVIVLVVLTLTSEVLNTWSRASGQLQSFFEGGLVGNIIQEDLESAFMKRDDNIWFTVNYPAERVGMLTGTDYKDSLPMRPPDLMFYSRTTMRPIYNYTSGTKQIIPGSLCAVKYKMTVKNPFMEASGNSSESETQTNAFYGLYRAVLDSNSTMTEFIPDAYNAANSGDMKRSLADFWDSGKSSVLDEEGVYKRGTSLAGWVVSPENLLTSNLVDFRITFGIRYLNTDSTSSYDPVKYKIAYIPPGVGFSIGRTLEFLDADGINKVYEITKSGRNSAGITESDLANATLASADISMIFISEKGAKEMRALMRTANLTEERFKELVGNHGSKAISKRIEFVSEPQE